MRYILLLLLFISTNAFSQWKSYIIGVKGDTLNTVDMKGRKQGRWVTKVEELRGEPGYEEEGLYVNGRKEGTWRRFSPAGDLTAVENYRWGNKDGKNIYFNNMGNPIREESWKSVNPDNPYDTVNVYDINDPTKIISRKVVKLEGYSLRNGTWKFYDPMTGAVEKTEDWNLDKPVVQANDDLKPLDVSDSTGDATADKAEVKAKKIAKPQVVLDYEKKNSGKKKMKVRDGSTGY